MFSKKKTTNDKTKVKIIAISQDAVEVENCENFHFGPNKPKK